MKQLTHIEYHCIRDGAYAPVDVLGRGSWPHDGLYYVTDKDGAWSDYVTEIYTDREIAVEEIANQDGITSYRLPRFVFLACTWPECSAAMTEILRDDPDRLSNQWLAELAANAYGPVTREKAQAELDKRADAQYDFTCYLCDGDLRVGNHGIRVGSAYYNEPPDYRCEGDRDDYELEF